MGKGEKEGGEGEGPRRRRREREEERERRKGRERELERVHWALPALTRLQSRLTALQFVHSPNATPGTALLLLSLVEFYCDAEEEGLPHLLPALTGYTTLLLPRHLHDEGVAEATLEFFLRRCRRIQALDPAFLPEASLLLLKAFAWHCHVPHLQPIFLQLLPHLVAPSTALQLTVAALDLPGTPRCWQRRWPVCMPCALVPCGALFPCLHVLGTPSVHPTCLSVRGLAKGYPACMRCCTPCLCTLWYSLPACATAHPPCALCGVPCLWMLPFTLIVHPVHVYQMCYGAPWVSP